MVLNQAKSSKFPSLYRQNSSFPVCSLVETPLLHLFAHLLKSVVAMPFWEGVLHHWGDIHSQLAGHHRREPPFTVACYLFRTSSISKSSGHSFPVTNSRLCSASYAIPFSTASEFARSASGSSPVKSIHPVTCPSCGEMIAM